MTPITFTKTQRARIMSEYAAAMGTYNAAMNADEYDRAKGFLAIANSREREYFTRLPHVPMSCCPFDNEPLIRSFDSFGFDGLWWASAATPNELPSCPHFRVLLGAVNFGGGEPKGGSFEVRPGPEAPYVVPRLLDLSGMIAVVSQIPMETGFLAYPVAYFSDIPPLPEDLVPGWARSTYAYTSAAGEPGWKGANDPWDFELLPWLLDGRIRWCPPEDPSTLSSDPPEQCPYLNVSGRRERIAILDDTFWTEGVPIGGATFPID